MSIQHLHARELEHAAITSEEAQKAAMDIVQSLGSSYKDFQHASDTYNSVFFQGEDGVFTQAVCSALKGHFSNYQNSFWNKASGAR